MKIFSTLSKGIAATAMLFLFSLSPVFANNITYTGKVVYANEKQTPLPGVEVMLKDLDGNVRYTVFSDENGDYEFKDIEKASYILDFAYDREVKSVDFQDLYLIKKHLLGEIELKGWAYKLSDVDGSGVLDWNDYWHFMIDWFLHGKEFDGGKWVFESRLITEDELSMKGPPGGQGGVNGDPDGGFEPGDDGKDTPIGIGLVYDDEIGITANDIYDIPVYFKGDELLGGFALVFNCSENIRIEDIISSNPQLRFTYNDNILKVSLMDKIGNNLSSNESELFTIRAYVPRTLVNTELIGLDPKSHLINSNGKMIYNSSISIPKINNDEKQAELMDIYPNPVRKVSKIEYRLYEESRVNLSVYNMNGQKVATLVDALQSANNYQVDLDIDRLNLANGMYFYRLDSFGGQVFTESKMFIVSK